MEMFKKICPNTTTLISCLILFIFAIIAFISVIVGMDRDIIKYLIIVEYIAGIVYLVSRIKVDINNGYKNEN